MPSKSLTYAARDLGDGQAGRLGTEPAGQISGAQIRLIAVAIALAFWAGIAMMIVDLLRG